MIDAIHEANGNSAVEYTPTPFPPKPPDPHDTALLSLTAQAKLLEQHGLSVTEIADELGVTANAVQSDLGIPIASSQPKVATGSTG